MTKTVTVFTARELALHAARLCLDKGADEVRVLSLPTGIGLFDFVVLATARSDRQTNAMAEDVYRFCKQHGVPHRPVEGEAGWFLVDCFDVIVHVLGAEQRLHYDLDRLWLKARDVNVEAEVKKLAKLPEAAVAADEA